MRRLAMLALLAGLAACDPFPSVQAEGTIEAYEQYLKDYPDSTYKLQARNELEGLYLAEARAEPSLESYDRYLDRFKNGVFRDEALKEREEFLFSWAEKTNTPDAWKKFLDEYKHADKARKKQARAFMKVGEFKDQLALSPVRMEQVNLAEDPEGPLNGWGFYVDVTNNTAKTLTTLSLNIYYLDSEGNRLDSDKWPVVAPDFGIPMEEEKKVPMKPKETRTWEWTTGDLPDGWARRVDVIPSAIAFPDTSTRSR